jgi:hypothetical protein
MTKIIKLRCSEKQSKVAKWCVEEGKGGLGFTIKPRKGRHVRFFFCLLPLLLSSY